MPRPRLRRSSARLAAEVAARRALRASLAASRRQLVEMQAHSESVICAKDLAGRQLADSEQRWRALVERSPVAVAVLGLDGCFEYANPQAEILYGSAAGGLVGSSSLQHVPPGGEDATRKMFTDALAGTAVVGRRWVLLRLDGVRVDVEINAAAVQYDGKPAVQVELRDMTAQVASEEALRESEHRWRSLFADSPVGIGLIDDHGLFVAANRALCSLLGSPESEVLGQRAVRFTDVGDVDLRRDIGAEIDSAPAGVLAIETRLVRPDGELRWASVTVTRTPGPDGQRWTLAHIQDITRRRAGEQAMIDSEANLIAVSAVAQQIQSGGDARQTIVDAARDLARASYATLLEPSADQAGLEVTAATDPELLGSVVSLAATSATVGVYRSGQALFLSDPPSHAAVSMSMLALSDSHSIYFVPIRSGASVVAVLVVGWTQRVEDLDDRRARVVALLADQTAVALRQASLLVELEALALTDKLTGLPNRRSWDGHLSQLVALAERTSKPLTIAIADLDNFKTYNDLHGHQAGDVLLCRFADAAPAVLRKGDTVARWGGEEFAIALPDCMDLEATQVLERVRRAVPDEQTCSIGYATWNRNETLEQLIARADGALYVAKRSGRNRTSASADRSGLPSPV